MLDVHLGENLPSSNPQVHWYQLIMTGLPHPGKVLESPGFFFCPGKSLNFVYKSWKKLGKFSRDLPGQNVKFFVVAVITGTL